MKILSVGQCGMDNRSIGKLLADRFGAAVDTAQSAAEATRKAATAGYALILVNRIFDADGGSGLDLVATLAKANATVPVMLVSDRADAQDAAVAAGAVRGFGKSALVKPETASTIERALAAAAKAPGRSPSSHR